MSCPLRVSVLALALAAGPILGAQAPVPSPSAPAPAAQPALPLPARPLWFLEDTDRGAHFALDGEAVYQRWGMSVRKRELADGKVGWTVEGGFPFAARDGRVFALDKPASLNAVAPDKAFGTFPPSPDRVAELACLDARTGQTVWKALIPTEKPVAVGVGGVAVIQSGLKGPVVTADEVLVGTFGGALFKGRTGKLYAFSRTDGKPLWSFEAEDGLEHPPLIYKHLALLGGVAACYGVDLKTGKQVWKAETRSDNQWTFTLAGDTLLMASGHYQAQKSMSGGTLYAFRAEDGSLLWKYDIGGPSELRVADGRVVGIEWGSFGGTRLSCLDLASGKKLWEFKAKGSAWPQVVDGKVVFLDRDNRIHLLELATGKETATLPAAGDFQMGFFKGPWGRFMDPVLLQGRAVVGSWDKGRKETVLEVLDVQQGKVVQTLRVPGALEDQACREDRLVLLTRKPDETLRLEVYGR